MNEPLTISDLLARIEAAWHQGSASEGADGIHAPPEQSVALTRAFVRIADEGTRRAVLDLVEALGRPPEPSL